MKRVRSLAEFGLVAAFGATLTIQATRTQLAQQVPAPAPTMAEIEAAVAFAERQALEVNGRR